jgi:hypothetical protein
MSKMYFPSYENRCKKEYDLMCNLLKTAICVLIMFFSTAAIAQDLPRIAVYVTGEVQDSVKGALGTMMLSALTGLGRYEGIEYSNAFLAETEKEHVTQLNGTIDDSQISELGKQFDVAYICIADITPLFDAYEISARIVNVETAVVVHIGEAYSSLQTVDDFRQASHEAVRIMLEVKEQVEYKPQPNPEPQPTITTAPASAVEQPLPAAQPPRTTDDVMVNGHKLAEPKPTVNPQSRFSGLSSAFMIPAGFISYSIRDGYRKYEDVREIEHVDRENLVMYGFSGGKRFALKNQRLRIQSAIEFGWGWGSVIDDVYKGVQFTDGNFRDISMHSELFTVGIQNELHILLPSTGENSYFLSIGPGVGWSSFKRAGKAHSGFQIPGMEETTNNTQYNFNIGAGVDHMINRRRALSISYNFRIWRPVSYEEKALFPMGGVEYKEQFFTHMLQAQILIIPTTRGRSR